MKRYILAGLAAILLLGGGFYWFAPYNIAASVPHIPGGADVLHGYLRNAVKQRAVGVDLPPQVDLDDPGLIRLGAGHFATGCATCHGAPGIERNPIVIGMRPAPPMLNGLDFDAREFWWITRHGFKYTGMPGWAGQDRDDEPWALAAFLENYGTFDRARYEKAAFGREGALDGDAVRFGGLASGFDQSLTCARCHGSDGLGRDGTAPKLAGQSAEWLALVLDAYAEGHRESGFMEPIAAPLGQAAQDVIAERYAAMEVEWTGRPLPFGDASRGAQLAQTGREHDDIAACSACHEGGGPDGLSPKRADTPRIAGQDAYWIYNWLLMYRDGPVPETPRAHLMAASAGPLSDEDIADLAAYYASLRNQSEQAE